ncbi:MAG: hypothetical protein LW712_12310 [Burkholderiaceae bacterium]|jgi:hypothetical protein|nr:hypothetical protein [Burkholderiaceae bacterium]
MREAGTQDRPATPMIRPAVKSLQYAGFPDFRISGFPDFRVSGFPGFLKAADLPAHWTRNGLAQQFAQSVACVGRRNTPVPESQGAGLLG